MKNYKEIVKLAGEILIAEDKLNGKHTKAESARQRKRINEIRKLSVEAKKELMKKDNA